MSQASSPICPFRTLPDLKSFGNPATAETSFGFDLLACVSFVELVTTDRLEVQELLELEQLYNPLTRDRESKRQ